MEEGGLRKKKGCFGFALLNSVIWSLRHSPNQCLSKQYHEQSLETDSGVDIRIIPPNTHNLGSFFQRSH
jgi:hypothetical protein